MLFIFPVIELRRKRLARTRGSGRSRTGQAVAYKTKKGNRSSRTRTLVRVSRKVRRLLVISMEVDFLFWFVHTVLDFQQTEPRRKSQVGIEGKKCNAAGK